jgi:hypothetical protein
VKLRIGFLPPKLHQARQVGDLFLFTKFRNSTGENGSMLAPWPQIDCYRNQDE